MNIILKEITGDKSFTSKKVLIKPFPVIHKEYLSDNKNYKTGAISWI